MEVLGYGCAVIIGLILGLIGGGGSILSVPVLAYLYHLDAVTATAYSLFVVGCTSAVGSVGYFKARQVRLSTALWFGLPSLLGVIFSRRLVVPHLPHYIIHRWGITLTKDMFLLLVFAVLMLLAAYKMIAAASISSTSTKPSAARTTLLISQGLLVGIVTGLIGAGGGFLIVPALVMLLGLKMKEAVGTSLFIIAINSLIGFASSLDSLSIRWTFLLTFTALSILGISIGLMLAKRIDGKRLKPLFGWLVLVMGIYIIIKELLLTSR